MPLVNQPRGELQRVGDVGDSGVLPLVHAYARGRGRISFQQRSRYVFVLKRVQATLPFHSLFPILCRAKLFFDKGFVRCPDVLRRWQSIVPNLASIQVRT